jgi:hypothetical protein
MLEKTTVESQHGYGWTVMSDSRKDEIVDDHFVPNEVREQYTARDRCGSRLSSRASFSQLDSPSFENDIITKPLSQPASTTTKQSVHKTQSLNRDTEGFGFTRNKLRSYSIRAKVSPVASRKFVPEDIVPFFERDVNDLDSEVDLPDESLMMDHVDTQTKNEEFQRLRPLRYSFGRKLKHKIDHAQSTSDLTSDYMVTNINIDSPSLQDLSQVGPMSSTLDLTDSMNDLVHHQRPHSSITTRSRQDDNISLAPSITSPEPSGRMSIRGRLVPPRSCESPFKHPLSRSVRAGSSYMTVTSEYADRRHMFKKKQANSGNNSREGTPVRNDVEKKESTSSNNNTIPIIKTNSSTDCSSSTDYTTSDLVSPMCSPPASPAAHGPKRESGYISSFEASDEEESHHNRPPYSYSKSKRRTNRSLQVDNSLLH